MNQLNTDLRMEWEALSTPELEDKLRQELEKKPPDDDVVLILLHILEKREPVLPLELTPGDKEAWKRYQKKRCKRKKPKLIFGRWLSIAVSVALVCMLLLPVIPQKAEAETFWEMLQRITTTVLEYLSPRETLLDIESTYVFQTENPGLQEVYDAVVGIGIMDPVVPMWLPDGYELTNLSSKNTPMLTGIWATFSDGYNEMIYKVDVYSGEPAHQYYKDDTHFESHEWLGMTYNVARNNDRWLVVWEKDNMECSLTLDCNEDTLWRILNSIYVTEAE